MDFKDVKVVSYKHQNKFFGESMLRYGSTIEMEIVGSILNLVNTEGSEAIFDACRKLSSDLNYSQQILINNIDYGIGRIKNVSFDSGNWVKVTEYSVTVELEKEASLSAVLSSSEKNLTPEILNHLKSSVAFLEDFSESYDVNYSSGEDSINGSHNINIKVSSLFQGDKVSFAQNLASFLLSKASLGDLSSFVYNSPNENLRKELFTEDYNLTDWSFGFKRSFSFSNSSDCYSSERVHSIELLEDGIVNVTEKNKITGRCGSMVSGYVSTIASAKQGFSLETAGNNVFNRCEQARVNYFPGADALILKEKSRSVSINDFSGEIEYSISFTNDKKFKNDFFHTFTLQLSREESGVWTVSENGSLVGDGTIGSDEKFKKAFDGWSLESGKISGRLTGFYASGAKIRPSGSPPPTGINGLLKFISKQKTHSVYDGKIDYSIVYTDDMSIDMNSPVRRRSITVSDNKGTKIHNDFIVPGGAGGVLKYALAQLTKQSNQSSRTVNGELDVAFTGASNSFFNGYSFFNSGLSLASGSRGTGNDLYLEDFSFSSDEIEQSLSFQAVYKYSAPGVI